MKWTRAKFLGKRDDGTPLEYTGYALGPICVTRQGRRVTYYDVIHRPSGVSIRPRWLHLRKLVEAKLYAERVLALQPVETWEGMTASLMVVNGIRDIALRMRAEADFPYPGETGPTG